MKYLLTLIALILAPMVHAQTDCTPIGNGGYSCYDYDSGTFSDIAPRAGGGYETYDYGFWNI